MYKDFGIRNPASYISIPAVKHGNDIPEMKSS